MEPHVVLVHGIRTSATMWRAQVAHLRERGVAAEAVDLPGHGTRMDEPWSLDEAFATIDRAVTRAAEDGPVVLVAHSMGGLLSTAYLGGATADPISETTPPVAAYVAMGCTAFPAGAGLAAIRSILAATRRLPGRGLWLARRFVALQTPPETRADFGAGGYAIDVEDDELSDLSSLGLEGALTRLNERGVPTWFVNGSWDQMRLNERAFTRLVPNAELIVVPRSTHLLPAMRPHVANALIDLATATAADSVPSGSSW